MIAAFINALLVVAMLALVWADTRRERAYIKASRDPTYLARIRRAGF